MLRWNDAQKVVKVTLLGDAMVNAHRQGKATQKPNILSFVADDTSHQPLFVCSSYAGELRSSEMVSARQYDVNSVPQKNTGSNHSSYSLWRRILVCPNGKIGLHNSPESTPRISIWRFDTCFGVSSASTAPPGGYIEEHCNRGRVLCERRLWSDWSG